MKKIFSIIGLLAVFSMSCTKKLEDPGTTATQAMSNEWWVTLDVDGTDVLGAHILFYTYNTSRNVADSLWLDDGGNGYQFKVMTKADPASLTFSTDSAQNEYYDIKATIKNGKIIPNGGHSKTGIVTDSIYMEAIFTDDPATTYVISGVARTRWADDDYN
jgi:hypothetical protein